VVEINQLSWSLIEAIFNIRLLFKILVLPSFYFEDLEGEGLVSTELFFSILSLELVVEPL
jgi:hypothetical protein